MEKKNRELIDYYDYCEYIKENLPESWKRVFENHNISEVAITMIASYCLTACFTRAEMYTHLHENALICAANWEYTPQGTDWWMSLNNEADMLENQGCIKTYANGKDPN